MKANMVRFALDRLGVFGPETEARILERCGDEVVGRIRSATRVEWIPATDQVALNDAIRAEVSREAYLEFWGETGLLAARDSIFSQVAQGAMRLFGVSPSSLYKILPRANKHVTRDVGEYQIDVDPDGRFVVVTFHSIAPELLKTDSWFLSASVTIKTPLLLLGRDGRVEVDEENYEEGRFRWIVSWDDA